jgi:hypothetical protein
MLVRRAVLPRTVLPSLAAALLLVVTGCGGGASQEHTSQEHTTPHGADSAAVELQPTNDSGVSGTATFTKADGGVRVKLNLRGLPQPQTSYLSHIHPGACGDEDHTHHGHEDEATEHHGEAHEHGYEHGEHAEHHGTAYEHAHEGGPADEIEYPLTPVESDAEGRGSSTTVLEDLTLEVLFSGEHKYINVHAVGTGEPPQLACANLNEAH